MASNRQNRATVPDFGSTAADGTQSDIRRVVPMHAVPWLVVTLEQLRRMPLGKPGSPLANLCRDLFWTKPIGMMQSQEITGASS